MALPRLKTPIKGEVLEGESISPPNIFMYYFAYGSNMSLDHMRRLCGWHCQLLGRATLPEFEIGLDKRGYANIKANPKELVYGVLFEIDEDGIKLLDGFEGYPDIFDRAEVEVFDENKVVYKAQVYWEPKEELDGTEPKQEYFRRVIAAAHDNKLPQEWIKKLEQFAQ